MARLLVLALAVFGLQPATPERILFIGNSLTDQNDLPGMVCTLARVDGL